MTIANGTRLGPYEIISPAGAGGMGEVYRARDTRLGRDVAIKVLPEHLSSSPDLRARFEREARAVSSLNHPHICILHDVGREGETDYLVMEMVEGDTLADRLAKGPLAIDQILKIGAEIADALDKAHRAGIIHRDLKPGNVMLTKSGSKLMDFGLARAAGLGPASSDLTNSPTMTRPLTQEGHIVGTFQYMAPEQLDGGDADARSDIWALGCVLYEMTAGKRAFDGKTQASLIGSIMNANAAPLSQVAPMTPPALDRLVRGCLARDPDERVQTAHDVKLQLDWIRDAGSQGGVPAPVVAHRKSRERLAWGVAGAMTLALLAGAALLLPPTLRRPAAPPPMRFSVTAPENATMTIDPVLSAISPDGHAVIFIATDSTTTPRLWVRPLASLVAQPIAGTENALLPFWSPDSRYVGFFADGKLKKVSLVGGAPEVLCDAPDGRGGSWNQNGVILFAPMAAGPLHRVSAQGGAVVEVVRPDSTRGETGLRWPEWLPDGKHFLFVSLPSHEGNFDVYLGSLDSRERKLFLVSSAAPVVAAPDHLILVRNGRLVSQRFDARQNTIMGEAIPLGESPPLSQSVGARSVSASTTGILAHPSAGLPNTQLVWLDRTGKQIGTIPLPAGRYESLSLSPDGQRLMVGRRSSATSVDLWMVELSRSVPTRFTFATSGLAENHFWSPDGRWVAYNQNRAGPQNIYRLRADGGGVEETLLESSTLFKNLTQWSPDGRYLVYYLPDATTGWDLWLLPAEGDRKPVPYLRSRFNEYSGSISPDGRWMAYISDESGKFEAYVQSFPTPANKYQVSTTGAFNGIWSRDGTEMLLAGLDGSTLVADVRTSPSFTAGTPRVLFKARSDVVSFMAAPDLQRFLVSIPVGAVAPPTLVLELNWTSALAP